MVRCRRSLQGPTEAPRRAGGADEGGGVLGRGLGKVEGFWEGENGGRCEVVQGWREAGMGYWKGGWA